MPSAPDAKIEHDFDGVQSMSRGRTQWDPEGQQWKRKRGKPANPGLVLYARVDGSFSAWDPARNYRLYTRADGGESESPSAYQFSSEEVLWSLKRSVEVAGVRREETLCLGLIDEWREWQKAGDSKFELLTALLESLGLEPGKLVRPSIDDVREIPTIRMPYGQDVPITYAPAGVKRMAKLAYLLAWAMAEHETESKRVGRDPSGQVILLIDEVETHLHPGWQRTVLPSLMDAVSKWRPNEPPDVQLLVTTHSPLVLTSIEPQFDVAKDALWKLDLVDGAVTIERDEWHKRGDAQMWLMSDVFDGTSPYSREAQEAMSNAADVMNKDSDEGEAEDVRTLLRQHLADTDPFWLDWRSWRRSRGWSA